MSSTTHRSAGDRLEGVAADRLDAEHVPDRVARWFDLETASGEPVDVKACKLEHKNGYQNGKPRTTAGRFWIPREHHERLVEAGGYYALVVYEEPDEDELEVVKFALLPAAFLEAYISEWSDTGEQTRHDAEQAAKVPNTDVFPGLSEGSNAS